MFFPALALLVLAASPASVDPPASRRNSGYFHVSPGFIGFVPVADATLTTWGVGADLGWHFGRGELTGQLGVTYDDQVVLPDGREHQFFGGPRLRLGKTLGARARIFLYGGVAVGPTLSVFEYGSWIGIGATVGPGLQFLLSEHFTIGIEPTLAIGGEAFSQIRARGFIGYRF